MASKDSLKEKRNERQTEDEVNTQRLIRLYRANRCLWNPYSPGYHCMPLKQSAWNRITRILNNGLTTDQVKGQVLSLRNYYDMERQAIKRSQREGFHYVPCRSIFNDLQFLADQELGEAEEAKPSVRDDQVQCIIDDVMPVMNKDCAECRRSLQVDYHIPIGEKRSDSIISFSNNSFEEEEYDSSSLYESDLETLPAALPRATSGADRQYHRQDEEESSDSSYHHQCRQQYHGRGAREGGSQRYSRAAENYSHSCYYEHRSNHTTDVSVGDEESPCRVQNMSSPRQYGATGQKGALASNTRSTPKQHQQVQSPRPRSGMEASNCDSQGSKNSICRPSTDKKACNVLLLKFNPRNSKRPPTNHKTICVNPPANYSENREDNRDYRDNNISEQDLQSAETPVYEDSKYYGSNENGALPADADYCCSYDRSAQYTQVYGQQNLQQNEPNESFFYPEGADPYECIECYCPPDQLYRQEDQGAPVANQGPTRRRPPPPFSEYHNTGPDAYRFRQNAPPAAARTRDELRASSSKDINASAPNVRSWGSRSSGPDSYVAQQCAAVAAQIMKDYRLRKCVQPTYPDDDSDFCDEPVARRPQKHYQTADMVSVECPARRRQQRSRNEVDREASAKRQSGRGSTPTKVPNSRDPQQKFLASLKSNYDNQGRRTPNQYGQDRQPGQDEYDGQECVTDCPGISDRFPPPCLSALSDYNNQEGGQEKFNRKPSPPSPPSTPYEDNDTDVEQRPKQIPPRRSYPREEAQSRRAPPPYQRSEETACNESCPSLNQNAMDVPPRQAPRRTSDRGQYSQPLTSQQQRRRSDNINDLQSYRKERRPPSARQQQLRGPSNSDVDYIECPNRRPSPGAENAGYANPAGKKRRNMEDTEEPYMANRSLPSRPNNRQPISTQNSNQMYRRQEKPMPPFEVDECLCEDEPMVPDRTLARRSRQNDRQPERTAPEIASPKRTSRNSPRDEPTSPEDRQEEPTAPKIASSKRTSRNSPRDEPSSPEDRQEEPTAPEIAPRWKNSLGIPSSKRNSRDDRQQEQSPRQTFQRRSYQREEPAQHPPQSKGFEEISCNNESCAFQNRNVPEAASSMINSQEDRQPKSTPTSNKIYRGQEKSMHLVEVDECLCEDEPMVSESVSARRIGQNDRQQEVTAPEIASPKRNSRNSPRDEPSSPEDRQEEPTGPQIASPKRNSLNSRRNKPIVDETDECPCEVESMVPEISAQRSWQNDRQQEGIASEIASPKRNSLNSRGIKPIVDEADECPCEVEFMVPEISAQRSWQNERPDGRIVPEIGSEKRISRQQKSSVPEIASSKRTSRNSRRDEPRSPEDRQEEPTGPETAAPKRNSLNSRGNKPIVDEADECPCEDEPMVPESTSAKRSRQNDRQQEGIAPEIASSKRSSQNGRQAIEIDECLCDDEPEIAASNRNRIKNNRKDDADLKKENMKYGNDIEEPEKNTRKGNSAAKNDVNEESSESDYEDAVNCERNPNECSKMANGRNSLKNEGPERASSLMGTGRKDQDNVGSDSEYCDFECGVECPRRKNIRNEPGNSKNTKSTIRGDYKGPESVSEKKNQIKSKVEVDDSSSSCDCVCFCEHKEENQTDEKQAEEPSDEQQAEELIEKESTDETESKSPKPVDKDSSVESAEDTQPKAQRGRNNTAQGVLPAQRKPRAQYVGKASTLPAGVKCPRCQAIAARSNTVPKSRLRSCSNPEETAKKAIPARSSSGPCGRPNCQISGKRSMKHADYGGGPSKPFDLRLASYYICQLQDDDEANQYLIIVPEAKFRRISAHRDCPRQEPAKRGPCSPRQCSGFETLSWASSRPAHQSYPRKTEGISVLGSYLVPPVAAETTMTIIKQHINKSIVERKPPKELIQKSPKNSSSKKNDKSPPKMPRKPKTKPMTSMVQTQTSIQRPIHETNSILAENRTVLLTNNPSPKSNQEVIVLHPPVLGFRPSKNSLGLDDVQMQYVKVQHSESHISPKPMKKPNLS